MQAALATAPLQASSARRGRAPLLAAVFFVSGVPALVYQLLWQRALFTIYGVNIESITVVVSAFMLGLGIGSILGGAVSKRPGVPHLLVFAGAELGIGLFGIASLPLFQWVGSQTLGGSTFATGLYTFSLVLLPTALMGGTLPMLVAHLVQRSKNVGRSIGLLYFVNTLGSAFACFFAGLFLFGFFGMSGSVLVAAVLNFLVGAGALIAHLFGSGATEEAREEPDQPVAAAVLPFRSALLLAGAVGFISLSYEIIWARLFSFVSGASPDAFPFLLGAFLLGIALGAHFVKRFCGQAVPAFRRLLVRFLLLVNTVGFLVLPGVALLVRRVDYHWGLLLVTAAAAGLGACLPLICHAAIAPDERAGQRLSWIYLANIAGSTTGSLVTGFVLLDLLSLTTTSLVVFVAALLLCAAQLRGEPWRAWRPMAASLLVLVAASPIFGSLYERLLQKKKYDGRPFAHTVETRSGVINVDADRVIYGGGIYDGQFSVDLVTDTNMIIRPFSLAAFHPRPRRVLMIGLSSGSWAQVIAHHPDVESLTIVEINRGYLELLDAYEVSKTLPHNPKVTIAIDDGRRWLRRHRDARFDAIVMNTTHHWRSSASNVLSVEFMELARSRLDPGGVVFYNTTWSDEAARTGATVFPHALRVVNFLVGSDSPIDLDAGRWRRVLESYRIDGRPVFDLGNPEHVARIDAVVGITETLAHPGFERMAWERRDLLLARTEGVRLITDDNMGTEWRRRWRGLR